MHVSHPIRFPQDVPASAADELRPRSGVVALALMVAILAAAVSIALPAYGVVPPGAEDPSILWSAG